MNTWIDVAGWTLVHFLWQGSLIALAAGLALRFLRAASPQARYVTACVALAGMLAAPLVTARLLSSPPFTERPPRVFAAVTALAAAQPASIAAASESPAAPAAAAPAAAPSLGRRFDAWLPFIVILWSGGVGVLLMRLAGGWWRIRRLHRASLASDPSRWNGAAARLAPLIGLRRLVVVVDCPHVDTPTVVGWMKPVILMPIAALSNLSPAQVDAILAHELAHVRRHDFIVNLAQTLAETFLFYHPAVWWMSGRIRAEREHCCDLVAVDVCGDPVSYAEALTELESWRIADSTLAVAATGGSLIERVRRVLGVRSDEGLRTFHGVTIGSVLVVFVLLAGATHYPSAAQPDADTRPAGRNSPGSPADAVAWRFVFNHGTTELNMIGFTGRELIRYAYQIPDSRIVGGPDWIDDETFRVVVNLDDAPRADEMQSIVRQTLEDRFHLKTHVETRELPAYALVMARADRRPGPNLRLSRLDCFDLQAWIDAGQPPRPVVPNAERQPICGEQASETISRSSYRAMSMPQFAEEMRGFSRISPRSRGRDVIDRTGLSGRYDIDLYAFAPTAALMALHPIWKPLLEPLGLPSIPTALEQQLGLRLEESTAPYDVIVIDSAERPAI